MATADQIATADTARRGSDRPVGRFTEPKADHILGGAFNASPGETGAARLLGREAPDIAARLDLPDLPPDAAATLIGLVAHGDLTAARAWIGELTRAEVSAVRSALAARRRDR